MTNFTCEYCAYTNDNTRKTEPDYRDPSKTVALIWCPKYHDHVKIAAPACDSGIDCRG